MVFSGVLRDRTLLSQAVRGAYLLGVVHAVPRRPNIEEDGW
jgi:hypothetical protein